MNDSSPLARASKRRKIALDELDAPCDQANTPTTPRTSFGPLESAAWRQGLIRSSGRRKTPIKTYGSQKARRRTLETSDLAITQAQDEVQPARDGQIVDQAIGAMGSFADSAYHSMSTSVSAEGTRSENGDARNVDFVQTPVKERTRASILANINGNKSSLASSRKLSKKQKRQRKRSSQALQIVPRSPSQSAQVANKEKSTKDLSSESEAKQANNNATIAEQQREVEETEQDPTLRSSGRQRRKPRRYSNPLLESITVNATTATTSSKRKRNSRESPTESLNNLTSSQALDEISKKIYGTARIPTPQVISEAQLDNITGDVDGLQGSFNQSPAKKKKETSTKKVTATDAADTLMEDVTQAPDPGNEPKLRSSRYKSRISLKKHSDEAFLSPSPTDSHEVLLPAEIEPASSLPIASRVLEPEAFHPTLPAAQKLQAIFADDQEAALSAKAEILKGLTGLRRLPLVGLDEEYHKVHQLVEQTIIAGEGNSMFVIGARGSAKTTLVDSVITQLKFDHQDAFHVVRLNGFIHTDDKLALKGIWRQLGKEMDVQEESWAAPNSYADTLTSLLALLSHPEEMLHANGDNSQTTKSVVFIIDEFDLFASHPRQTLLYNLFDVAQSRKAPIAVLGLTTKVNILEHLEKRVKSRFSHRHVYLCLPRSFAAFKDICKSALTVQSRAGISTVPRTFQDRIQAKDSTTDAAIDAVLPAWTAYLSNLFDNDKVFERLLRQIYARSKSIATFMTAAYLPISMLSSTRIPTGVDFVQNALLPPDSKLELLSGLSELELSLLIAAARLDIILSTDTCNFNMVYDEYVQLASKVKLQSSASGAVAVAGGARVWNREIAFGAWEKLADLDFVVPAQGIGGVAAAGDVGKGGKMWKVDVSLEELGACRLDMSSATAKWCREI
ncbi:hypothetical protein MMC09_006669 [Bachmanniomyces sp. S44760]|nr:hypothetical protein [Bachmanniomyces sp. S44760]